MSNNRIESIVNAWLGRGDENTSETMIVANHLAQMRMYGVRQGIEFLPKQPDEMGMRQQKIQDVIKENELDLYYDIFLDYLVGDGELLFYLVDDGKKYQIYWFFKGEFKATYKTGGKDLDKVVIKYSYRVQDPMSMSVDIEGVDGIGYQKKYIRLIVTDQTISKTEYDQDPGFSSITIGGNTETTPNPFGKIACRVIKNLAVRPGGAGRSDFDSVANQITSHDELCINARENMEYFASPTLATSLMPNQVTEPADHGNTGMGSPSRPSATSNSGFAGSGQLSTRKSDPVSRRPGAIRERVRRLIGGLDPSERLSYISPDPISGDHTKYADDYRESIHQSLGSVDPLAYRSGTTFGEIKTLYGQISRTAGKKCEALYTFGLCKIFEMIIEREEAKFKVSFLENINMNLAAMKKPLIDINMLTDDFLLNMAKQRMIPPNTAGIPPWGSREVIWRFKGPVFEETAQDRQATSIVVRNLQELGVNSLEGLKILFPDKTEQELEGILAGGFPFRYVGSILQSTNSLLGLLQQLNATPDLMTGQPLSTQILGVKELIAYTLGIIHKETSYVQHFEPATIGTGSATPTLPSVGNSGPSATVDSSGTNERRALPGSPPDRLPPNPSNPTNPAGTSPTVPAPYGSLPFVPYTVVPPNNPIPPGPAPGTGQQPMEVGFGSNYGVPENSGLPGPGSTVTGSTWGNGQLQFPPVQYPGSYPGSPDLATQPGILEQYFPTFTAIASKLRPGRRAGKSRRKPK